MTNDRLILRYFRRDGASLSQSQGIAAIALVVVATSIGLAIHLHDGEYSPGALAFITLALIAGGIAVLAPPVRISWTALTLALSAALAIQLAALFMAWPGQDLPQIGHHPLLPFHVGLGIMSGWIVLGLLGPSTAARTIWFPATLATFILLGFWLIHRSPNPHIDVWVFQQEGSAQFLHGRNPYAMTFPDIYESTAPGHQQVYGEGLSINGRLQFGFPYPPVSLLLSTIGYGLAGDCRYGQVVALALAALLLGYIGPGQGPKLAAALLLTTPRIFFILMRGWTEPFAVMLLAATIYCACRRSRWLVVALGLLLATKQYMILAIPLTFFLLPRDWRWSDWFKLISKAALIALAVTLPLALWDPRAFWHSVVTVQERAPFRWDALSYLVWYGFRGHLVTEPMTTIVWSSLAALFALSLSLWKAPRSPAGFAASLSFIFTAFFAFNKQAFCNYYFWVIGAACCAIAAASFAVGRQASAGATDGASLESEENASGGV